MKFKNRFSLKVKLLTILVCNIILFACGPTSPEIIKIDPAFSKYVKGYTSGMISRNESIRLELEGDSLHLLKYEVKELQKLFTFQPELKGKVIAVSDHIIEFVPDTLLPVNQFYTVKFELGNVIETESKFDNFTFQFSTFSQQLSMDLESVQNYGYQASIYQKLEGRVNTSELESVENIKKCIEVKFEGKNLKFELFKRNDHVEFQVDSILRNSKDQKLVVAFNGEPIRSFSKGKQEFNIASLDNFTVNRVFVDESDEQIVKIYFTDNLLSDQNLDGLIKLDSMEIANYEINKNVVSCYLSNRIEGNQKIYISNKIKNFASYNLKNDFSETLYFHESLPEVKLKGKGSILPNSQGLIFPFEAIALKSVSVRIIRIFETNVHNFLQENNLDGEDELTRFGKIIAEQSIDLTKDKSKNLKKWNTHIIDLQKLIKAERGAIYQVALKFEQSDVLCDCGDKNQIKDKEINEEDNSEEQDNLNENLWNERLWHSYGFRGYSNWQSYYDERENQNPCDEDYYYGKAVVRNILASDIGMIFKIDEDKTSHAFISNLVSTEPMSNVSVSYYDYNKELINSGVTNQNGILSIKLKRKPFLMVAKKGEQKGYLKLTDAKANTLSKFNVDGQLIQKGVKGFIYSDRGVYRPGDSLYFTFMLQDKLDILPSNHPVSFSFNDPENHTVKEYKTAVNTNGVYVFKTATNDNSPTGNYNLQVKLGNYSYSKSVKIETIKPNRLKIDLKVNLGKNKDSCKMDVKWLHGANAGNLKANVQVKLNPMNTVIKGCKDYEFDSPIRVNSSDNITVFSGELDSVGHASFSSTILKNNKSAGLLQANYVSTVFEKGGEFSIDRKIETYSPYQVYVGLKAPESKEYESVLELNKNQNFSVITVSEEGKKISDIQMDVLVYKIDWDWWYTQEENLADFVGRTSTILYQEQKLISKNGIANFQLKVQNDDFGKYLVLVTDKENGHQTGKVVYFDRPYWSRVNRSDNEFASMLSFSLDKEKYSVGEKIKVNFPSPVNGKALISIENSEKVLKTFWINTIKGETNFDFVADANMAPNAYVHVTMTQPHHTTTNDLPIRMYGIMPVMVENPQTHLYPVITMPDKIRPESTVSVAISEKNNKKMTYTLAIVDDGLLDLTHFKTPQPWNVFYAKEALGVKTWDLYGDVIGAHSGTIDHLITIGGDGNAITGNGPKANRFKPMVRFLGPFTIDAGKNKIHKIDIPNYIGSVRVMVVGRNEESYGCEQKTVSVKKPLMVLATLPRTIGPNENFALPVNVFAMEDFVKNVSIDLTFNEFFETSDPKNKSLVFKQTGDELVDFNLKTKDKMGIGKISVLVKSGKETAHYDIEIDVRPSNPEIFETTVSELKPGETKESYVIFDGYVGSNFATVELSTLPSIRLEERLQYLIQYPHGCVEQTTSAVFAQLYLPLFVELSNKERNNIDYNIKSAIDKLAGFQTSSGGLSYWPGHNFENEWGTNYAGHFLIEAELAGFKLPNGLKEKLIKYQKDMAVNWQKSNDSYDDQILTQAYRLYLLAKAGEEELGAMNRLREEKNMSDVARYRLAAAYQIIGQPEIAKTLVNTTATSIFYKIPGSTFGSQFRDKAMILEAMGTGLDSKESLTFMRNLAQELSSAKWLSTQETAFGLIAISSYCKKNKSKIGAANVIVDTETTISKTNIEKIQKIQVIENGSAKRKINIKNTGTSNLFVSITTRKIPKLMNIKKESSGLYLNLQFLDLNKRTISVEKLKQGTEILMQFQIENTNSKFAYRELALTQIIPCGWEIYPERILGSQGYINQSDYQDIRDDRVMSYYNLEPNETKTITIKLTATYKGKFFLPMTFTDAMYDHSIFAQIPGKWIEVY